MGRKRTGPWLRKQDRCWYTTVGRKSVRLGTSAQPYDEIEQAYHALLANQRQKLRPPETVSELCERFLEATRRSRAASTHAWYAAHLSRCVAFLGRSLRPEELSGATVDRWLDQDFRNCTETTKNGAARTIVRVMNWALAERLIERSPLAGYVKPTPRSRDQFVSEAEYAECLQHALGPFRDLLVFIWETGCRPQEARIIEADWISDRVVRIPADLSKGKRRARVIYLTAEAEKIVRLLAADNPQGKLFRNSRARAWTKDAINCAFVRLKKRTGIKHVCAYGLRHGFATRALKRGLDSTTVGVLMGHANPSMVARVYQHLAGDSEYLLGALDQ